MIPSFDLEKHCLDFLLNLTRAGVRVPLVAQLGYTCMLPISSFQVECDPNTPHDWIILVKKHRYNSSDEGNNNDIID